MQHYTFLDVGSSLCTCAQTMEHKTSSTMKHSDASTGQVKPIKRPSSIVLHLNYRKKNYVLIYPRDKGAETETVIS